MKPEGESAPCWFVSNAGVQEKDAVEPKFLSRSLATLRVLLKNARLATSQKIKAEYEGRKQRNAEACAVFEANFYMWRYVEGPRWDDLRDPSNEALQRAQDAKARLVAIRDQQDGADNAGEIASACVKAAARGRRAFMMMRQVFARSFRSVAMGLCVLGWARSPPWIWRPSGARSSLGRRPP